jgi:hypothetical protein
VYSYGIIPNEATSLPPPPAHCVSIGDQGLLFFLGLSIALHHEFGLGVIGGVFMQGISNSCVLKGPLWNREALSVWDLTTALGSLAVVLRQLGSFALDDRTAIDCVQVCASFSLVFLFC